MVSIIRSIWNYKNFILGMVKRDFQSRYLNSTLGLVWAIVNPLALILVYTLIFTQIMQAKLPEIESQWAYSIYLCAGVLPWNYFVESIQRMQNLFFEQSNLIKKLNFPKITLPVYILISSTINFVISMLILLFS